MTREEMYEDFLKVCSMNASETTKVGMLTHLFSAHDNPWRVIGITREALNVFKDYGFQRKSKMGINRSHIFGRSETYKKMLQKKFNSCKDWWDHYYENDKTILATSSENKKKIPFTEIFYFSEELNMFKSKGYAWEHGEKEKSVLENLYNEKITKLN